jgi:hypothetical protein
MNNEKLTTLDPDNTYVDYLGRKWTHSHGAYWRAPKMVTLMYDLILLQMIPDLKLHTPEWYEPLLEKGWVKVNGRNMVANITVNGDHAYINPTHMEGQFVFTQCPPEGTGRARFGTLEDCLATAEPLVWKGVAK